MRSPGDPVPGVVGMIAGAESLDENLKLFIDVVAGVIGANVGSFLNVCIYRMPREHLSVSRPRRSFCPGCGNWIAWYDNIPLVSWIVLGGRCRYCRAPISSRYFVVEALTASLFVIVALRYLGGVEAHWGAFFAVIVFVAAMVVASFIDVELRILPDEITIGGMIVVPFVALAVPELHSDPVDHLVASLLHELAPLARIAAEQFPDGLRGTAATIVLIAAASVVGVCVGLYGYAGYWRVVHRAEPKPLRDGLLGGVLTASLLGVVAAVLLHPEWILGPHVYSYASAMLGMLAGSTLIFGVGVLGTKVFRKPAMGFGDVKLMGLLGALTGWEGVIAGFFIACFLGSGVGIFLLLKYRSRYLPFGPFLAVGALLMLLWPEALGAFLHWYQQIFR